MHFFCLSSGYIFFHLIKYKLLVFIMRAPASPLQCYFWFLVQHQVPSASTWWMMPIFILHVFNFQTSAFALSLSGSPLMSSEGVLCRHAQSHCVGLSPVPPSHFLLHCLLGACPWSQYLFIAPMAEAIMVFWLLFVPLSFCGYPGIFCVFYSPCKLVKWLYSWGVCTAHTDRWGLWTCQEHRGATVMQIIVIIKVQ